MQGRAEGGPLGEAAPSQPSLQVTKHSLYFIMGPNVDRAPAHCGTLDPSPPPLLGLAPLAATLTQSALINASPGTQRLAPPTPPPPPTTGFFLFSYPSFPKCQCHEGVLLPLWWVLFPQPLNGAWSMEGGSGAPVGPRQASGSSSPTSRPALPGCLLPVLPPGAGTRPRCVQGSRCAGGEASQGGTVRTQRESVHTSQGLAFLPGTAAKPRPRRGCQAPGMA